MKNFLIKSLSSLFFIGYIPYAPGTFGSLFSYVILWYILSHTFYGLLVFVGFLFFGIWICGYAELVFGVKDDKRIVIDELIGAAFSVLFIPKKIVWYVLAFILFRFFDIRKPFFISRVQALKSGYGVVLDDLIAGIYANLVLRGLLEGYRIWKIYSLDF